MLQIKYAKQVACDQKTGFLTQAGDGIALTYNFESYYKKNVILTNGSAEISASYLI